MSKNKKSLKIIQNTEEVIVNNHTKIIEKLTSIINASDSQTNFSEIIAGLEESKAEVLDHLSYLKSIQSSDNCSVSNIFNEVLILVDSNPFIQCFLDCIGTLSSTSNEVEN